MRNFVGYIVGLIVGAVIFGGAYRLLTESPENTEPTQTPGLVESESTDAVAGSAPMEPVQRQPATPPPPPPRTTRPTAPARETRIAQPPPAPVVTEQTAQEDVDAMVARQRNQANSCYQISLMDDPGLFGSLRAEIEIGTDGRVESVEFSANSINDRDLEDCLEDEIRKWRFDASAEPFTGSYTFTFSP